MMSQEICKVTVPLVNFDSDSSVLPLWKGMAILKMNYKEFHDLYKVAFPSIELLNMKYVLELENISSFMSDWVNLTRTKIEKPFEIEDSQYCQIKAAVFIADFIRTLRLYKNGSVFAPFILFKEIGMTDYRLDKAYGEIYLLKKSEVGELLNLHRRIVDPSFGTSNNVKLAMHRFSTSYSEEEYEDKIIDYFIAFESLFSVGNTRQKGNSVAIGASMLLGKDNAERAHIREDLERAYGVRNDIIHDSLSIEKSFKKRTICDEVVTFTSKVEDYLRDCIKKLG
jgi:hypothetical protein